MVGGGFGICFDARHTSLVHTASAPRLLHFLPFSLLHPLLHPPSPHFHLPPPPTPQYLSAPPTSSTIILLFLPTLSGARVRTWAGRSRGFFSKRGGLWGREGGGGGVIGGWVGGGRAFVWLFRGGVGVVGGGEEESGREIWF